MTMVLIFQLAFVQAMAANGELHHHFHDHAEDTSHHCAVTMLLNGGFDVVVPDAMQVTEIAGEIPPATRCLRDPVEVEPSHLVGGVLAHAPPRGP